MSASRCYICTEITDDDGYPICGTCTDFLFGAPHEVTPTLDKRQQVIVREKLRTCLLETQKTMRAQPKPCPNCSSRTVEVAHEDKSSRTAMQCAECGLRGPWSNSKDVTARALWDGLPR